MRSTRPAPRRRSPTPGSRSRTTTFRTTSAGRSLRTASWSPRTAPPGRSPATSSSRRRPGRRRGQHAPRDQHRHGGRRRLHRQQQHDRVCRCGGNGTTTTRRRRQPVPRDRADGRASRLEHPGEHGHRDLISHDERAAARRLRGHQLSAARSRRDDRREHRSARATTTGAITVYVHRHRQPDFEGIYVPRRPRHVRNNNVGGIYSRAPPPSVGFVVRGIETTGAGANVTLTGNTVRQHDPPANSISGRDQAEPRPR